MHNHHHKGSAMTAKTHHGPRHNHKAPPPHPDYADEISSKQIEVIRHLADPDGKRAAKRVLMYPSVA